MNSMSLAIQSSLLLYVIGILLCAHFGINPSLSVAVAIGVISGIMPSLVQIVWWKVSDE